MEKFCRGISEHATKIINFEKKYIPLSDEEDDLKQKSYLKQKICPICKNKFIFDIYIVTVKICL